MTTVLVQSYNSEYRVALATSLSLAVRLFDSLLSDVKIEVVPTLMLSMTTRATCMVLMYVPLKRQWMHASGDTDVERQGN